MTRIGAMIVLAGALAALAAARAEMAPEQRKSGADFMSAAARAMQEDDTANPAMLATLDDGDEVGREGCLSLPQVFCVGWNADGRRLASGSVDQTIRVCRVDEQCAVRGPAARCCRPPRSRPAVGQLATLGALSPTSRPVNFTPGTPPHTPRPTHIPHSSSAAQGGV